MRQTSFISKLQVNRRLQLRGCIAAKERGRRTRHPRGAGNESVMSSNGDDDDDDDDDALSAVMS